MPRFLKFTENKQALLRTQRKYIGAFFAQSITQSFETKKYNSGNFNQDRIRLLLTYIYLCFFFLSFGNIYTNICFLVEYKHVRARSGYFQIEIAHTRCYLSLRIYCLV